MLAGIVREVVELRTPERRRVDQLPLGRAQREESGLRPVGTDRVAGLGDRRPSGASGEQVLPFEPRWGREPEQRADRREDVDALRLLGDAAGDDAGTGDDQRNAQQLVVQLGAVPEAAMLLEFLAVVRGHQDHGRFTHPGSREPLEQTAERRVPGPHLRLVQRPEVAHGCRPEGRVSAVVDRQREVLHVSTRDRGRNALRRDRPQGGRWIVGLVRLHVVEVGEEAPAGVLVEPVEEDAVHVARARLLAAVPVLRQRDEGLEASREVGFAGDHEVRRHADRRDAALLGVSGKGRQRVREKARLDPVPGEAVARRMEAREDGRDRGHRPRRLGNRALEHEPLPREPIEARAGARGGTVATELVGAQRVHQEEEHVRRIGARRLPVAVRLVEHAHVAPARYPGRSTRGHGDVRAERELYLRFGEAAQLDAVVEPATVAVAGGGVDGAGEDLLAVDAHREADAGQACVPGRGPLHPGAQLEHGVGGKAEAMANARRRWRQEGGPAAAVQLVVGIRLELAGADGRIGGLGHHGAAVERSGEVGDDVLDRDAGGQAEGRAARDAVDREREGETEPDGAHDRDPRGSHSTYPSARSFARRSRSPSVTGGAGGASASSAASCCRKAAACGAVANRSSRSAGSCSRS